MVYLVDYSVYILEFSRVSAKLHEDLMNEYALTF